MDIFNFDPKMVLSFYLTLFRISVVLFVMGRDSGGNNKEAQLQARHQQARSKPPPAQDEPITATQSSNASPWAGNIINIKI